MSGQHSYHLKALEKLVGCRITGLVETKEDEFGDSFFGISVKNDDKNKEFYLLFLSDDEGNGPGSFEISEVKKDGEFGEAEKGEE